MVDLCGAGALRTNRVPTSTTLCIVSKRKCVAWYEVFGTVWLGMRKFPFVCVYVRVCVCVCLSLIGVRKEWLCPERFMRRESCQLYLQGGRGGSESGTCWEQANHAATRCPVDKKNEKNTRSDGSKRENQCELVQRQTKHDLDDAGDGDDKNR